MTREEIGAELRAIVARSFGIDPATVSNTTTAEDVDGWNSLAHATLVMRVERIFNVDLDRSAAFGAQDLGALSDLIVSSLQARDDQLHP